MSANPRSQELNQLTKDSITSAMLILLKKKPFARITISELCSCAGVSRNAYYRNFANTRQVLQEYFQIQWERYAEEHKPEYHLPEQNADLFRAYVYDRREQIILLKKQGLMSIMEELLLKALGPDKDAHGAERYIKSCLAYMVYGFIVAMADNDFSDSPQEIDQLFHQMQVSR